MSYTIVGMFPEQDQAEKATSKLAAEGFSTEDYNYSTFSHTKDVKNVNDVGYDHYDYEEDEKTSGFWNWLFGDEEHTKTKYSYAGSKNNIVTVFADTIENAEKAKAILNDEGAINVHNEAKDFVARRNTDSSTNYKVDEAERARIISKAKNNLYFTDKRRYSVRNEGMDNDMDSQGSNDTIV